MTCGLDLSRLDQLIDTLNFRARQTRAKPSSFPSSGALAAGGRDDDGARSVGARGAPLALNGAANRRPIAEVMRIPAFLAFELALGSALVGVGAFEEVSGDALMVAPPQWKSQLCRCTSHSRSLGTRRAITTGC